jgi:hypothetical protein
MSTAGHVSFHSFDISKIISKRHVNCQRKEAQIYRLTKTFHRDFYYNRIKETATQNPMT